MVLLLVVQSQQEHRPNKAMFSQEARLSKKLKAAKALPVLLMRDLGAPPKIFATDLITPLPSLTTFRH
jgi:hypothetical protein